MLVEVRPDNRPRVRKRPRAPSQKVVYDLAEVPVSLLDGIRPIIVGPGMEDCQADQVNGNLLLPSCRISAYVCVVLRPIPAASTPPKVCGHEFAFVGDGHYFDVFAPLEVLLAVAHGRQPRPLFPCIVVFGQKFSTALTPIADHFLTSP